MVDPSIMFSHGFIYSFLATFALEIFKIYYKKSIVVSFCIYMIKKVLPHSLAEALTFLL